MIIGYHLIWVAYGWWLPNDPRGSTSKLIRNLALVDLGDIHYGRKRIQPAGRVLKEFYEAAREVLKYPLQKFSKQEVAAIAESFENVIHKRTYTCYACAIMPEHIHLLIRKHRDSAEEMIEQFQEASRKQVLAATMRCEDHPVWGGPGWKVFLDTQRDMHRTVHYIEQNPVKIGLPQQHWDFVNKYDGWKPGFVRFAKPQARGPRSRKSR